MKTFENVTVYTLGNTSIRHVRCRTLSVEVGPYAQHEFAIHLTCVPKGQRKNRSLIVMGDDTVAMVAAGMDSPEPRSPWENNGGILSQTIGYVSREDLEEELRALLGNSEVVYDSAHDLLTFIEDNYQLPDWLNDALTNPVTSKVRLL